MSGREAYLNKLRRARLHGDSSNTWYLKSSRPICATRFSSRFKPDAAADAANERALLRNRDGKRRRPAITLPKVSI